MDQPSPPSFPDDAIDFRDLARRIRAGLSRSIGLCLIGLAIAAIGYVVVSPFLPATTTARIVFSFPGYEHGQYPDKSKFQPDDLRSPEIVLDALGSLGFKTTSEFQAEIRSALTIEGLIPPSIISERDRLRAAGQSLPPFMPDEHRLTLSLAAHFPLSPRQRELLLDEIVNAYRLRFQRTYVQLPLSFGNAFETLKDADYFEYELVLNEEIQNISTYLDDQMETAKTFRSRNTNFSFGDLRKQTRIFTQISLNETLGLIRQYGLSKNRQAAMTKMDYYLHTLEAQETTAVEEAKVVQELLTKAQDRGQNYVLGLKSQGTPGKQESPVVDQGLIDSLLANDAYNFLIREALAAGLKVKRVHAEKAIWLERRTAMETFLKERNAERQEEIIKQVSKSLGELQQSYAQLVTNIRKTHEEFERQQFADAVRESMQAKTESFYRKLTSVIGIGALIGLVLGLGLSLLTPNHKPRP